MNMHASPRFLQDERQLLDIHMQRAAEFLDLDQPSVAGRPKLNHPLRATCSSMRDIHSI